MGRSSYSILQEVYQCLVDAQATFVDIIESIGTKLIAPIIALSCLGRYHKSIELHHVQHPISLLLFGGDNVKRMVSDVAADPTGVQGEDESPGPRQIIFAMSSNKEQGAALHYYCKRERQDDLKTGRNPAMCRDVVHSAIMKLADHPITRSLFGIRVLNAAEATSISSGHQIGHKTIDSQASDTVDPVDTVIGMVECNVLPFLLTYVCGERENHFEMMPQRLLVIAILADIVYNCCNIDIRLRSSNEWMQVNNDYAQDINVRPSESDRSFIIERVCAVLEHALEGGYLRKPLVDATQFMWDVLRLRGHVDMIFVPSVLAFPSIHTSEEWYMRLFTLQYTVSVMVYPLLRVECRMENKASYMKYLMSEDACSYVPLHERIAKAKRLTPDMRKLVEAPKEKRSITTHVTVSLVRPEPVPVPSLSAPPSAAPSSSSSSSSSSAPPSAAPSSSSSSSAASSPSLSLDIPCHFVEDNPHFAPTIFFTSAAFRAASRRQTGFVAMMKALLTQEAKRNNWIVADQKFIIKGCNSTRGGVFINTSSEAKMMEFIRHHGDVINSRNLTPRVACQHEFMMQPCMRGLAREVDLLDIATRISTGATQELDTFNCLLVAALPRYVDFACHILAHCEKHCKLVSESGFTRVDIGSDWMLEEEFARLRWRNGIDMSKRYMKVNEYRVRFFCNEVTTTTDINLFSFESIPDVVHSFVRGIQLEVTKQLKELHKKKKRLSLSYACPSTHPRDVCYTFPHGHPFTSLQSRVTAIQDARRQLLYIPKHGEIDDSSWLDVKRLCDEHVHRIVGWGRDNKFGFDHDLLLRRAQYSDHRIGAISAAAVTTAAVTTTNETDIARILPNTPPRIFKFAPNVQLQAILKDWDTFSAYHAECIGNIGIWAVNIDTKTSILLKSVKSCSVARYKTDYLAKYFIDMEIAMKKSKSDRHDRIVQAPYLMNVKIDDVAFHQLMRASSDIIKRYDDGPYSLNYFMRSIGRKFPLVSGMLYISPPTHGGVGTPFHLDGQGSQASIHACILGGESFNRVYSVAGEWNEEGEIAVREGTRMVSMDEAKLPLEETKRRFDCGSDSPRNLGPDPSFASSHIGYQRAELHPGQVVILPASTRHAFQKDCADDYRIDSSSPPLVGYALDASACGDTALSVALNVEAMVKATQIAREYCRTNLAYPFTGAMSMAVLYDRQPDLVTSHQARGILLFVNIWMELETYCIETYCIGEPELQTESASTIDFVCSRCNGEVVNLYAITDHLADADKDAAVCLYCPQCVCESSIIVQLHFCRRFLNHTTLARIQAKLALHAKTCAIDSDDALTLNEIEKRVRYAIMKH